MKHSSMDDRAVNFAAVFLVSLFAICCLYPLIYCLSMSFSSDAAVWENSITLLPKGFNLNSYSTVLSKNQFWLSLRNSAIIVVFGTIWGVACTFTLGYVMTRKNFVFRKFMQVYILIPMFFGGGLIPTFLLIKGLHLYNTLWAIILPGGVSIWNAILVKTFIQTNIPEEMMESAVIDGANDFQIFLRLIVPLSTTIIAIISLYDAVSLWNNYFSPLIYLQDVDLQPLQLYLRNILLKSTAIMDDTSTDPSMIKAALVSNIRTQYVLVVVSTVPIIIFYPFLQKYFVKGVMLGSIKG
ncbi:MAG: carbohydrate ABC transporter permease [Clostridia bacterium]|nr:carbohydrate ABC transporter permease [Clostridia bacterium]